MPQLHNQVITSKLLEIVRSILEMNRPKINSVLARYPQPGGGKVTLGPIFSGRRPTRKLERFPNIAMSVTSRSPQWTASRQTKETVSLRIFCTVQEPDSDSHEDIMNDLTDVVESILFQNPIFSFNILDGDSLTESIITVSNSTVMGDTRGTVDDGYLKAGQIDWTCEMLILWPDMNLATNIPDIEEITSLTFQEYPSNSYSGEMLFRQPVVIVQNALGNPILNYNGNVTMAIKAGTGTPGAILAEHTTVQAINGVAAFYDLSILKAGTDYVLEASAVGTSIKGESAFFDIEPVATQLEFSIHPASGSTGELATAPVVNIVDSDGNVVEDYAGFVAIEIVDEGLAGGYIEGVTSVLPVLGVATFSNLSIPVAGTYTLKVTSGILQVDTSDSFTLA